MLRRLIFLAADVATTSLSTDGSCTLLRGASLWYTYQPLPVFCPKRPSLHSASGICVTSRLGTKEAGVSLRILAPTSRPARSCIWKRPIGKPNLRTTASTCVGSAPSSSMHMALKPPVRIMRFDTKPKQLPTMTGAFLIFLPTAIEVAMVWALDALPRTNSSSFITLAGLKKWAPMTDSGRFVAEAISSMLRVDVLDARTHEALHTASSLPKICFLSAMFSKTASMT
mmetsp:Transcript_45363/g.139905  ORF Transcript_45363/g.139905 Transcript_45363/m.139905 type:complete len:227 (+) Transcript_45363:410-1090(+)